MNLATVDKIAKALLYEGYMLYPYRPSSVKNQHRWNFGVLFPRPYSEVQNGTEAWTMQTECLLEGGSVTTVEVRIRFLQLVARTAGKLTTPATELLPGQIPKYRPVERLEANGRVYQPWQEAIEREVQAPACNVEELAGNALTHTFAFPAERQFEILRSPSGKIVGTLIRDRNSLSGEVEIRGDRLVHGVFKIGVRIRNTTPFDVVVSTNREQALLSSLASTHTVLGTRNGSFVSLLAPPAHLSELAGRCLNIGTWPVLVGEEGQRDTVLSSRIILYDYPLTAPESIGDLFDGTEIDEILSLRIMTLTDDEKREMSQSDDRAREMLERTESMPVEQLMKLHGVLRSLRPLREESQ
jgi:hydrogenase maturation protease